MSPRTKQVKDDGRASKIHLGGQPKDWGPGEDPGIAFGDGAEIYLALP